MSQSKNIFVGNKYFPVEIWHLASRRLVWVHGKLLLLDRCQSTSHLKKKMFINILKVLTDLNFSFFLLWSFEWFVYCHKNVLNPFLSRTAVWVFIIILLVFCWFENIIVISMIVTALHLCTPIPSLVTINSSLASSCQPREAADINKYDESRGDRRPHPCSL